MPSDSHEQTVGEALLRTFPYAPTLGLGLTASPIFGPLAERAEEAGFTALWVPPEALGAAAEVTRNIAVVTTVEVGLSADSKPALPDPAGLRGRLTYVVRFVDLPLSARLSARAYRNAVARAMRKVQVLARDAGAPVLIQGSCHESLKWIADKAQGWVYDRARLDCVSTLLAEWRRVAGSKPFVQMLPGGPGLDERVNALLRAGVDHVAVMPSGVAERADLWRLPHALTRPE
ncbi:MAG TPA: hypothetical protein VD978_19975 [Azospirillum sp.]|nr:hypothetical protein [Azospirillum sp.]